MIIAVASGKGGTGKTTVATSLGLALDATTLFLDCDAEAPNAHLFLKPTFDRAENVATPIPRIDETQCTYCGHCAEVCQYHAIAIVNGNGVVFPNLCHGCGGCALACEEGPITEVPYPPNSPASVALRAVWERVRAALNVDVVAVTV